MFRTRPGPAIRRALLRTVFFLLVLVLIPTKAIMTASEGPVILPVWSGDVPEKLANVDEERTTNGSVVNVSTPMMYAYLLPDVRPSPAVVIIYPGGGYSHLAIEKEGHAVARWLKHSRSKRGHGKVAGCQRPDGRENTSIRGGHFRWPMIKRRRFLK
jgi:hypothetical protein